MSGAVLTAASESLQPFALAPRSGERVRERGPTSFAAPTPLPAAGVVGRRMTQVLDAAIAKRPSAEASIGLGVTLLVAFVIGAVALILVAAPASG